MPTLDSITPIRNFYAANERWIIILTMAVFFPAGFVSLDYYAASVYENKMIFLTLHSPPDALFPFFPSFVWVYLLYYPICFLPVLLIGPIRVFRRIALAYAFEFFIGFAFFAVFPVRMIRPNFEVTSASTAALKWIYAADPGHNIFPSLHVANAFLVAFIFYKVRNAREGIALTVAAVLISISAMCVKQHYFLDVMAGFILACAAYFLAFLYQDRSGQRPMDQLSIS